MGLANKDIPTLRYGNLILPSEILGGVGLGIGNVYLVANKSDTASYASLEAQYGTIVYPDGTSMFHGATAATADVAIQAALDSCVANRNDYVVIMPSSTNYSITATLQVSKKAVHIICPTGLSGNSFPIGNTARLKSITAAQNIFAITTGVEAVEIAGFYLKNYADLAAITIATGCSALNIHHNMFPMVWSSSPVASIVGTGSGGAWGSIENNWWISESGTSVTAAIAAVDLAAQATGARVCHNEITIGDANTATLCISNLAVKGRTDFNTFSESGGSGVTSGGTITNAISVPVNGAAIGNRGAVASGELLSGGTANTSFCDNLDGRATSGTDIWNLQA
jgi:hypothetical protein